MRQSAKEMKYVGASGKQMYVPVFAAEVEIFWGGPAWERGQKKKM